MLHNLIAPKTNQWLLGPDCPVKEIIAHIEKEGALRDAQVEAIKTYLFLKIEGRNKPLWQLFSEGFFLNGQDLAKLNINEKARRAFETNSAARALFEFARFKVNGESALPELEKYILENVENIDFESIIKAIFYGVSYTDYLFSLPMGAGKTFLMAAFIYLDLYFAQNEPQNKIFAHNFIVLVPSGLKSSIVPSLKTIANFDPTWILAEPAATDIKRLIKFEVLDQPKSAKKSNKARNPNAQKVNQYQPFEDLIGLVMVTNAEKVILDRLELTDQGLLFEKSDDEKDKAANELRNMIGKIPNLQIHIDEVHHAATDEIKLRQVVNKWNAGGTVNGVLGFSGTPYLSSGEDVIVSDGVRLKFSQITNTVYYYPLTRAIQMFLKKPTVKPITELDSLQIVRRGVKEFYANYKETIYGNGTCAKLAIYCGNIQRLEEQIYPLLVGDMKIPKEEVLKHHRGNSTHKIPKESQLEFASLDTPLSKKRIILLVQIGKEGWDCRSLTGVILSQKGDCPTNMVLQTSCRCLREVDKDALETAIIWLNEENSKSLQKQLREEQHTSIEEINKLGKVKADETVERYARLDYLKLPPVDFFQLKVQYNTLVVDTKFDPRKKVSEIKPEGFHSHAAVTERGLDVSAIRSREFLKTERGERANFRRWVFDISKGSFISVSLDQLLELEDVLAPVFKELTHNEHGELRFNALYDQAQIDSRVRLAFHPKRELQTSSEIVPQSARMLIVEKLAPVSKARKLYPNEDDTKRIVDIDGSGKSIEETETALSEAYRQALDVLSAQGLSFQPSVATELSQAVRNKDRTFHFLPYDFTQSRFELEFLKQALTLEEVRRRRLELYYNGERHLTDFKIECHERINGSWSRVGEYTPDFLLLERKGKKIHRALIIETKGSGFADQKGFAARRLFMETEFLRMNNKESGYRKFHYLYLSDADDMASGNLAKLNAEILNFFAD